MITQFYTLASDIFSTRDAKRLFGIIGTGGVIGSIIGGYIVRYLTKSIGIENFFHILAGAVFSYLVIINVIPRTINFTRLIPQPRAHFDYSILKSKHIRYISLATGIMLIVETLTDLQFNKLMGETFTGREIARIAKITEENSFEKGATIFNEGDPSDALYIIMQGKVNIIKDNELIKTLNKGDCFGEVGILDRDPRTAKAIVLEDAVLSRLGSEEFYELLGDNPQIAHGIFKILTEKLRESYET